MILYKYVSFDGGCAILNGKTIGFSNPWDFNDPFEMGVGSVCARTTRTRPFAFRRASWLLRRQDHHGIAAVARFTNNSRSFG